MNKVFGSLVLTLAMLLSCKSSVVPESQSGLSATISFGSNIGTSDKFYELLGGKSSKCPEFKGTGGCDGASAFLAFYQAKFSSKTCEDKAISGKDSSTASKVTLKQGCSYTLDLSYSEALKGKSCFAGKLDFSIPKGKTVLHIDPSVVPTQYCQSKGFPDLKVTTPKVDTSIVINPKIGNNGNNNPVSSAQSISVSSILNRIKESKDLLAYNEVVRSQEVLEAQVGKTLSTTAKLVDIRAGGSTLFYYFELIDSSLNAFAANNGFDFAFTVAQSTGTNSFRHMKAGDVFDITSSINYFSRESETYNYSCALNKTGTFTKK